MGYTVQGNMLASPDVWPAMAAAFEDAAGPLAGRLLAALYAGEAAGGTRGAGRRPCCSSSTTNPTNIRARACWSTCGSIITTRHSTNSRACSTRAGAFDAGLRSYAELMGGQSDAAVASAEAALARLPKDENFRFAHGIALVLAGDADAGRAELRALVGARPSWATIIRSFAAEGLLTLPGGVTVDSLLPDPVCG